MARTLLIVEDNELVLEMYRGCLKPLGCRLIEARSAEEALGLLEQEMPVLIVMDIMLPGMSGYDLLATLRSRPDTSWIPVIAVTNVAGPADRDALLQAGFDAFLPKPISIPQFVETVGAFLR